MRRREFIGSLGLILAAPAIVRAESLMRLWVPPEKELISLALYVGESFSKMPMHFNSVSEAVKLARPGDTIYFIDSCLSFI